MTQEIPLTRGYVAVVDDEDYDRVKAFSWHAKPHGLTVYARWKPRRGPGRFLHQLVLDTPPGYRTDHVDGNGLNNRRRNLRPATAFQNCANATKTSSAATSRFKGVTRRKKGDGFVWCARIRVHGQLIHLGLYESEEQAARAYDVAAVRHFGDFAKPNE